MDHDLLWSKLADYGMTGPYFDWIRMLYAKMQYAVRANGELSEQFHALCGVLMGDPCSPTLWNLFLADFTLPGDVDDAHLLTRAISHLEHADDMVIISTSPFGLQRHLGALASWCRANRLIVNGDKSKVMVFGPVIPGLGQLHLNGDFIPFVDTHRYVGITFRSSEGDVFKEHASVKADAAAGAAIGGVFGVEGLVGRGKVRPVVSLRLYTALCDPHLISGCEVMPDAQLGGLAYLENTQRRTLRRILGLGPRSISAVLHTETGIDPIGLRRCYLTMRYLAHLLTLPPSHYAALALRTSDVLRHRRQPCWLSDLEICVRRYLPEWSGFPAVPVMTEGYVSDLIDTMRRAGRRQLTDKINFMTRTYVLRQRAEVDEDGIPCFAHVRLRNYLRDIPTAEHRVALTRLICGGHNLRGVHSVDSDVPLHDQRCRKGCSALETIEHVLFACTADYALVGRRLRCLLNMAMSRPGWDWRLPGRELQVLRNILNDGSPAMLKGIAWLAFHAGKSFDCLSANPTDAGEAWANVAVDNILAEAAAGVGVAGTAPM